MYSAENLVQEHKILLFNVSNLHFKIHSSNFGNGDLSFLSYKGFSKISYVYKKLLKTKSIVKKLVENIQNRVGLAPTNPNQICIKSFCKRYV